MRLEKITVTPINYKRILFIASLAIELSLAVYFS